MNQIVAFVGHSFLEKDGEVVRKFLDFFDRVKEMGIGFDWDHAEPAEPKILSMKVREKMEGKNLFIGICTAKERVASPEKLKKSRINKRILKAKENEFSWKISDWILQEIGFAVGRDMDLILIVERGVQRLGGIQGNIDCIPFDRDFPEKSFSKILEMFKALMPKPVAVEERRSEDLLPEKVEQVGDSQKSEQVTTVKPKTAWKHDDYSSALLDAIIEKDKEKEEEIFKKYLEENKDLDEYDRIRWEVERIYYRHLFKREEGLTKLKRLRRKNPNHYGVIWNLGIIYEEYDENDKAAQCFQEAASNARNNSSKLRSLCKAAIAYSKLNDDCAAKLVLRQAKGIEDIVEEEVEVLLKTMSEIAEVNHDDINYTALTEGIIESKPDDHGSRFSLAYKYSEMNEDKLSLYHYKILAKRKPDETVWNNLGVAVNRLNLTGKAVRAYRESEKLDGTLAMSNLAQKLISAGFLKEAKEICNKATKIENYDHRVGTAVAKINESKENEAKKEQEFLESTKPRRLFYIEYAHACIKLSPLDLMGRWKGPDCDLRVVLKDGRFEAEGSFDKPKEPSTFWEIAHPDSTSSSETRKSLIKYSGDVLGFGIRYKSHVTEEGGRGLPSAIDKEGIMIISDDLNKIKVCEKDKGEESKFYSLERIETGD